MPNMSLAVITFTKSDRPLLLEKCKASVAAALPPGAVHTIINTTKYDPQDRFNAIKSAEFVAIVDDDDVIAPDALTLTLEAIQKFDAGIAFTREVVVDTEGVKKNYPIFQAKKLSDIASHTRYAHHLVMIRSNQIDDRVVAMHNKFGIGIDWFIVACAALNGKGAVHVPIDGYFWTHHADSQHAVQTREAFNLHFMEMSKLINEIFKYTDSTIPSLNI